MGQIRKITIKVYEHPIQINIDSDKEEVYRKAEKMLNEKLREYANTYSKIGRDVILSATAYELMLNQLIKDSEMKKVEKDIDKFLLEED